VFRIWSAFRFVSGLVSFRLAEAVPRGRNAALVENSGLWSRDAQANAIWRAVSRAPSVAAAGVARRCRGVRLDGAARR
jgi:hypothetical protein